MKNILFPLLFLMMTVPRHVPDYTDFTSFWKMPAEIKIPAKKPLAVRNWYVDPSASGSSNVGTITNPYLTLLKIETAAQTGLIHAGDSILLKRGETFYAHDQFNGIRWWAWAGYTCPSGTAALPIVWSGYGAGSVMPNILYPHPSSNTDTTSHNILSFEAVNYIILDGLQFNDASRFGPHNNKIAQAYSLAGVVFGESGGAESNNCIVRNCYFNHLGMGVVMSGNNNVIDHNTMEHFGNDYANSGNGGDYGANGITITGNNNTISYNVIKDAWAWSGDFGTNGGPIEWYNTNTNTNVFGNVFYDNGGLSEFGGQSAGHVAQNILFYGNLCINNGSCGYVNVSGAFAIQPSNLRYYNNTIIENDSSRWSGDHYPAGMENFPNLPGLETDLFTNNGSPSAPVVWDLRNNIVHSTTHMNNVRSASAGYTTHLNNISKFGSSSAGASNWGYTKDASEVLYTGLISNMWRSYVPTNVIISDLNLKTGSPALDIGQTISTVLGDHVGNPYSVPWDAGAYTFTASGAPVITPKTGYYPSRRIIKL